MKEPDLVNHSEWIYDASMWDCPYCLECCYFRYNTDFEYECSENEDEMCGFGSSCHFEK